MSLSKEAEIEVDDYKSETEVDEDGFPYESCDFSDTNLYEAVQEQVPPPDVKDWNIDEFEVMLNE